MNDRLNQFLAAEQLSPTRFADLIGVQRSGVSHILAGRNKPGYDFLEKLIKRFPSLNIEWFITGKGKMYKEMVSQPLFPDPPSSPVTPVTERTPDTPAVPDAPQLPLSVPSTVVADGSKTIEKVIIFYTDKTCAAYEIS
jgi:transcriptional regulator with XRE-family HTH domain